ncbi:MAG: HlyD family efflux transporter periplasmic adaptor subunit [Planctomycetota bacterium]
MAIARLLFRDADRLRIPIALILFLLLNTGCENPDNNSVKRPVSKKPLPVSVTELGPRTRIEATSIFYGKVAPRRKKTFVFGINGVLDSIVQIGQLVPANAPVAQLDTETLEQLRTEIQTAINTPDNGLDAEAIAARQRQLQQIETQLADSVLSASFDGVVEKTFFVEGDAVPANRPVVTLVERSQARVEIELPTRVAEILSIGQVVEFTIADQRMMGRCAEKSISESTVGNRMLKFDLLLLEPDRPTVNFGQIAELRLVSESSDLAFELPLTAVARTSTGLWSVLKVSESSDGNADVERVLVRVLYTSSDRVYIDGELAPDTRIVVDGLHRVVPGQTVTPISDSNIEPVQ